MGGGSQGKGKTDPTIPPQAAAMMGLTEEQMTAGLQMSPITAFLGQNVEPIAGVNPLTTQAGGVAGALMDPSTNPSVAYLTNLLSAPVGSSPDTQAAVQAWQSLVKPQVENSMMMAGLGRSGALPTALGLSETQAIVPFLQQEIQNRMTGAGELQQLKIGAAQAGMSIGDYLRNITQQQLDAPYQDFLRRQALTENLVGGASSMIPSTFGQRTKQTTIGPGLMGWLLGGSGMTGGEGWGK